MKPSTPPQAIGVFDTGVGGLTVMQQLLKELPQEQFIYFGDTARVPYGGKSPETIIRYSIENTIFLMQQSIKMLVIACNTVSAHALNKLQQIFNIPVVDVIEPGAHKAVKVTRNGRIAVLGTRATILSGAYQRAILEKNNRAEIIPIACPLFVPLVEECFLSHQATRMIIKEYLAPLKQANVDTLLLGCTHYPLLRDLIAEEIGPGVTIVDSAHTCSERVAEQLKKHQIINQSRSSLGHKYFVSDDPEKFKSLGKHFLGIAIDHVELVNPCL